MTIGRLFSALNHLFADTRHLTPETIDTVLFKELNSPKIYHMNSEFAVKERQHGL
jgi:hypothetical protein